MGMFVCQTKAVKHELYTRLYDTCKSHATRWSIWSQTSSTVGLCYGLHWLCEVNPKYNRNANSGDFVTSQSQSVKTKMKK